MDRVSLVNHLRRFARSGRRLGLHKATALARRALNSTIGTLAVQVDGLTLSGMAMHSSYLGRLRDGQVEVVTRQYIDAALAGSMNYVDVGANIGAYALLAAQMGCNVIAFEPDPRNREALERNIATNAFSNVDVRSAAVGAAPAELVLHLRDDDPTQTSAATDCASTQSLTVPVERLDDLTLRVDVVKVDVEGWEGQVLAGGTRVLRSATHVFIEYNPGALRAAGTDPAEFLEGLLALGHPVRAVIDDHAMATGPWPPAGERVVNLYLGSGLLDLHQG